MELMVGDIQKYLLELDALRRLRCISTSVRIPNKEVRQGIKIKGTTVKEAERRWLIRYGY